MGADSFAWRGPPALPQPPMAKVEDIGVGVDTDDLNRFSVLAKQQAHDQQHTAVSEYQRRYAPPPQPSQVSVGTEVTEQDLDPKPPMS